MTNAESPPKPVRVQPTDAVRVIAQRVLDCKAYEEWGKGHIGIVNLGNIPIHREHLEAAGNAVIDKDSTWDPVEAFKPAISAAKANGSLCIGQLTHGGRQVSSLIRESMVAPLLLSVCASRTNFAFTQHLSVLLITHRLMPWACTSMNPKP